MGVIHFCAKINGGVSMSSLPHYFIGIPVSKDLKETFSAWQRNLKAVFPFERWTYKDDFHITLRFLGPVKEVDILKLKEILKQIENQKVFSLNVDRIGTFGNKKRPRVLFAEVERKEALMVLHEHVEACLEYIGYSKETRPYHPHITLAKKWNNPDIIKEQVDKQKEHLQRNIAFKVNSVVLFQVLPKQTPKYRAIHRYVLRGENDGATD